MKKKIILTVVLIVAICGVAITQNTKMGNAVVEKIKKPIEVMFNGKKTQITDTVLFNDSVTILTLDYQDEQKKVNVTERVQEFFKNFKGAYTLDCSYPNGSSLSCQGVLAIKQDLFYDSSKVRFALINKDWMINVDHANKYLVLLDLKKAQEDKLNVGKLVKADLNTLLGSKETALEIVKENEETLLLRYELLSSNRTDLLTVSYNKRSNTVEKASLKAKFPMQLEDPWAYEDESKSANSGNLLSVDFQYYDMQFDVDDAFFSEKRIMYKKKGKVGLKKFIGYKVLNSI